MMARGSTLLPDGLTVEKVMKDLDVDKNGRIDYFEFEKYLLNEHKQIGENEAARHDGMAEAEMTVAGFRAAAEKAAEEAELSRSVERAVGEMQFADLQSNA